MGRKFRYTRQESERERQVHEKLSVPLQEVGSFRAKGKEDLQAKDTLI